MIKKRCQKSQTKVLFIFFCCSVIATIIIWMQSPNPEISLCEVLQQPCHFHASCYSRPGSYYCECNKGFFGDGYLCHDINECKEINCGSNSICINIIGSFECGCQHGYHQENTPYCEDINECLQSSPCDKNAVCLNTQGSFSCECNKNYSGNGFDCIYEPIKCEIPNDELFPYCSSKVLWMLKFWKSHPCYSREGVDGSKCSIISYLSEVENFCPLSLGQSKRNSTFNAFAELDRLDVDILTKYILWNKESFEWIENRIRSLWDKWVESYQAFARTQNLTKRKKKYILIFPGILAEKTWSWSIRAGQGGPLGELVQWADLIAGLYLLGHEVFAANTLKSLIFTFPCYNGVFEINNFDLIYTDIHGMKLLEEFQQFNFQKNKCKLRILDSFGTEARFNYLEPIDERYTGSVSISHTQMKDLMAGNHSYAGWKLNLKQFLTMFPHSDDNSFLGFVVVLDSAINSTKSKDNIALVYGKQDYMWKDCLPYLSYVNRYLSVHANVLPDAGKSRKKAKMKKKILYVPQFVNNHGFLPFDKLQKLLESTKIFVGLGFPFEGPAPLEAIGKGAVFLNPKFSPPFNRLRDVEFEKELFFKSKPTLREITSQHPYLERFVGKPHVYTVDIHNKSEVSLTIAEILNHFENNMIDSYLPFEFTHEGFLQRLNVFLQHQDFCEGASFWPPKSSLVIVLSNVSESCSTACFFQGLVCDNSLYVLVNNRLAFEDRSILCKNYIHLRSLYAPYVNVANGSCVLQKEQLLYSCVDSAPLYKRLCPCRKFLKGQIALCPGCS